MRGDQAGNVVCQIVRFNLSALLIVHLGSPQMEGFKTVPLARGLVGGETDPICGQVEIFLTGHNNVRVLIRRKPYTGRSDVKFSLPYTSLPSLIDLFHEALEKLDNIWLSRTATTELGAKARTAHASP